MQSFKKCGGEVFAPVKYASLAAHFQPFEPPGGARPVEAAAAGVDALRFQPCKRLIGVEVVARLQLMQLAHLRASCPIM